LIDVKFHKDLEFKKESVNEARRIEEAKRLQQSFQSQIKNFMLVIHDCTLFFSMFSQNQNPNNKFASRPTITENLNEDSIIDSKAQQKLLESVLQSSSSQLSPSDSVLILSAFQFCWCNEQAILFSKFILSLSHDLQYLAIHPIITFPTLQLFFISVLKPVFLLKVPQMFDSMISGIRANIKIFPSFLKIVIRNNPNIFYQSLLSYYIEYFFLFGIAPLDAVIFTDFTPFKERTAEFFQSDDGARFISDVMTSDETILSVPLEQMILMAFPDYQHLTIVDKEIRLFSSETSGSVQPLIKEQNLLTSAIEFLMKASLIRLENPPNSAFETFQKLAKLSSVFGDLDIEAALDRFAGFLENKNTPLADIINLIQKSIQSKADEGSMKQISSYSSQFSLIKSFIEICERFLSSLSIFACFQNDRKLAESKIPEYDFPSPISDPQPFLDLFSKIVSQIENTQKQKYYLPRTVLLVLLRKFNIAEIFDTNIELLENDKKLHEFLLVHQTEIIDVNAHKFLKTFNEDKSKLNLFDLYFKQAFATTYPFQRISFIHESFQVLEALLKIQNIGDLGADEILPFSIFSAVVSNPIGLMRVGTFITKIFSPIIQTCSPFEPHEEYSLVQFCSLINFVTKKMSESEISV
jgi:hypothetical protein